MAQIEKGVTFNNFPGANSQVTAELLNDHVANAKLISGAISEQTSAAPSATDSILIQRATSLFKTTIQQITDLVSSSFLLKTGGTMTGALTLSGAPTSANQAATKAYVDSAIPAPASSVPSGCIMMWGATTPPSGWIECNGQSTSPYPALAVLYGSTVPNLRDYFVRGWNGTEPIKKVSTSTVGEFTASINANFISWKDGTTPPAGSTNVVIGAIQQLTGTGNLCTTKSDATFNTGNTETRPKNVALMYIIKT